MEEAKNQDKPEIRKGNIIRKGEKRKVCKYTFQPKAESLATVREFIRTTLKSFDSIKPHVPDIVFAAHEACKNAVEHNPESDQPVDVVCEVFEDSVVIQVSDKGKGFDPRSVPKSMPDPTALAGRGIHLIHSLMDAVETKTGSDGTMVRMKKRITDC